MAGVVADDPLRLINVRMSAYGNLRVIFGRSNVLSELHRNPRLSRKSEYTELS
jgi:hypothetical protein